MPQLAQADEQQPGVAHLHKYLATNRVHDEERESPIAVESQRKGLSGEGELELLANALAPKPHKSSPGYPIMRMDPRPKENAESKWLQPRNLWRMMTSGGTTR